jgi:hypothetical protein
VEDRGISDVIAITFMLLVLLLAGAYMHGAGFEALSGAASRQLQLQAAYLFHALRLSQTENYSVPFFRALLENLLGIGEPVVPGEDLRAELSAVLEYLRPPDRGVGIELRFENRVWIQRVPENAPAPADEYVFSGTLTLVIAEAENRIAQVVARVSVFGA